MKANIIQSANTASNEEYEYIIDDGKKEIPVKNKLGEVLTVLRFRTTDINILERSEKAQNSVNCAVKKLSNVKIKSDGTGESSIDTELLSQAENEVREQINYIFGDDVCSELFNSCNPFSPVGGRFFVEGILDVLVKIINNEISRQQEEHIRKYTDDLE